MSTIRGLLTYVPTSPDRRIQPIGKAEGHVDRPPQRSCAPESVPARRIRNAPRADAAAAAAVSLSSLPPRRGLKADAAERHRYFGAYAAANDRAANENAPPPVWERRA